MRYLRPETTIIWFAFFIKALGWENLAQADPEMTREASTLIPLNLILTFFLSAFIFLCIGAVQYLLELLNSFFFTLKITEFMDLCSVSNISILIMDQHYHGFYVHGQAPWGKSDLVMS